MIVGQRRRRKCASLTDDKGYESATNSCIPLFSSLSVQSIMGAMAKILPLEYKDFPSVAGISRCLISYYFILSPPVDSHSRGVDATA